MYEQMKIFDFIDGPPDNQAPKAQFDQIFQKVSDPVTKCANCLCQYCTRNVEELYNTVKLEEVPENPCFNCDTCKAYTGEVTHKFCNMENCKNFIISDYGVRQNRKLFKLVK